MPNIFRQALEILDKNGARTEEEEELLAAASIPLDLLHVFDDLTTKEGLEKLVKFFDEKTQRLALKGGRC